MYIVTEITSTSLEFLHKTNKDLTARLESTHMQSCCETHELCFDDIDITDFEGLEFDLDSESFFTPIDEYGIHLIPTNGHSIPIPGYANNNGCYSDELTLELTFWSKLNPLVQPIRSKEYDITDCQC